MLRRISSIAGIASQVLGLVTILVASMISPWFSWTQQNLSVLGVQGSATTLFNSDLIFTGILGPLFAISFIKSIPIGQLSKVVMVSLVLGSLGGFCYGHIPAEH